MVAAKKADFNKWAALFSISPIVARILRNRELTEEEEVRKFLYGTLKDCYSPWLLKDMDKAVAAIQNAVEAKKKIRVIGDYDVDGICSAFILSKGLTYFGADVDTAIPHRIHDGYGLNENLIQSAKEDGVELIVTCDNGIAAAKQIELANSLGIDVVVTDHHEVPYELADGEKKECLPSALAIVDPKRRECTYPFKGICGGMVAYKVILALCESVEEQGGNSTTASGQQDIQDAKNTKYLLEELLEFAAFATVCDVMELVDENRIVVKAGLEHMRHSKNLGLRSLIEVNALEPDKLSAHHLGFVLGPCLNATGRLDTARRALELLQSTTRVEAMSAARELKEMNESRKNFTIKGVEAAEQYLLDHQMSEDKVLVIFLPDVHESLAGIIAGRIKEQFHKPAFVLTRGEEGVKGSGRSIETYHMYDALTEVKELFTKYGGHKMAAGLSLEEKNVEELRKRLNENCMLTEEDFVPVVHIDVPMPLEYATEQLAKELSVLEPFGVGNPKPVFAQKDLLFYAAQKMGAGGKCAKFYVKTPDGYKDQLTLFRNLEEFEEFVSEKYGKEALEQLYAGRGEVPVSVVYQLGMNTYRGRTEKQLIIQSFC